MMDRCRPVCDHNNDEHSRQLVILILGAWFIYTLATYFFSKRTIDISCELGVHAGRSLTITCCLDALIDHKLNLQLAVPRSTNK